MSEAERMLLVGLCHLFGSLSHLVNSLCFDDLATASTPRSCYSHVFCGVCCLVTQRDEPEKRCMTGKLSNLVLFYFALVGKLLEFAQSRAVPQIGKEKPLKQTDSEPPHPSHPPHRSEPLSHLKKMFRENFRVVPNKTRSISMYLRRSLTSSLCAHALLQLSNDPTTLHSKDSNPIDDNRPHFFAHTLQISDCFCVHILLHRTTHTDTVHARARCSPVELINTDETETRFQLVRRKIPKFSNRFNSCFLQQKPTPSPKRIILRDNFKFVWRSIGTQKNKIDGL